MYKILLSIVAIGILSSAAVAAEPPARERVQGPVKLTAGQMDSVTAGASFSASASSTNFGSLSLSASEIEASSFSLSVSSGGSSSSSVSFED